MLLSLRKNGLTYLFKEVRVFKGGSEALKSRADFREGDEDSNFSIFRVR